MSDFAKEIHNMFDHIWDCEIDHPVYQDTVGELMEAVIQAYEKHNLTLGTNLAEVGTDCISRQAAIEALTEYGNGRAVFISVGEAIIRIEQLPSAEPKRGKWIDKGITGDWQYQTDGKGRSWHEWQCDQCKDMVKKRSFYCPNCGADMRGEQDE